LGRLEAFFGVEWIAVVPVAVLRCLFTFLVATVLLTPSATAAASLYTGEVAVNSQSDADRAEALRAALIQVIVKVSGDNSIATRPAAIKAIASADHYVQQYQYTQNVVTDAGQTQVRLSLVAQFDRDAVDQLLRDLGLSQGNAAGDSAPAAAEMQSGSYRVWVSGVNSAADYARLIGTLSRNELVRSVQVEQARGDGLQLKLEVTGSLTRLLESLSTGPVRVLNAKPPVDGVDALLGVQP
jgi:hypothetical protein